MSRKSFDTVVSTVGLVLAVVLLIAGGLAIWGSTFVSGQVHDQLASQKIFFPPKGSAGLSPQEFPGLQQYAGQQVVNGKQAEAYANQFIGKHLQGVAGGKTYSEVSSAALANPNDQTLQGQVQTLFRGTTLRGLLLSSYAFWQTGQIIGILAIVMFAGGGILVILSGLGFWHAARVRSDQEIFRSIAESEAERVAA
jgi:hypothetical protein